MRHKEKHGMSFSPEYRTWADMLNRCYNTNIKNYAKYGARGISVCDEWRNSFAAFYADVGDRPYPSATIDRIDTHGNYTPENCRWASKITQSRNQRIRRTNGSGYTGVRWLNKNQKWQARITVDGKDSHIGNFPYLMDAVRARKQAEVELWDAR